MKNNRAKEETLFLINNSESIFSYDVADGVKIQKECAVSFASVPQEDIDELLLKVRENDREALEMYLQSLDELDIISRQYRINVPCSDGKIYLINGSILAVSALEGLFQSILILLPKFKETLKNTWDMWLNEESAWEFCHWTDTAFSRFVSLGLYNEVCQLLDLIPDIVNQSMQMQGDAEFWSIIRCAITDGWREGLTFGGMDLIKTLRDNGAKHQPIGASVEDTGSQAYFYFAMVTGRNKPIEENQMLIDLVKHESNPSDPFSQNVQNSSVFKVALKRKKKRLVSTLSEGLHPFAPVGFQRTCSFKWPTDHENIQKNKSKILQQIACNRGLKEVLSVEIPFFPFCKHGAQSIKSAKFWTRRANELVVEKYAHVHVKPFVLYLLEHEEEGWAEHILSRFVGGQNDFFGKKTLSLKFGDEAGGSMQKYNRQLLEKRFKILCEHDSLMGDNKRVEWVFDPNNGDMVSLPFSKSLIAVLDSDKAVLFQQKIMLALVDHLWENYAKFYYLTQMIMYLFLMITYCLAIFMWDLNDSDLRLSTQILCWVSLVNLVFFWLIELVELGQGISEYLLDISNYQDLATYMILTVGQISVLVDPEGENDSDFWKFLHAMSVTLGWLKVLQYWMYWKSTGPFVQMIVQMILQMIQFAAVALFFIMLFGFAFYILMRESQDDFSTLFLSILTLFRLGFAGDFDFTDVQENSAAVMLYVIFLLLMNTLLLNVLIALMATSYDEVMGKAEVIIVMNKSNAIARLLRTPYTQREGRIKLAKMLKDGIELEVAHSVEKDELEEKGQ